MSEMIGRLEIVPVRRVFKNEAQDFSTWLEGHIDALGERLNKTLTVIQREKWVGDFKVDLLCEDGQNHPVVIENQLEKSDHDHLGKLLTYLVNLDARTAVWIATDPRPEHQKVIEWLNESTPADISFYLVRVEAARVGDSPFAPLFTVLAAPDEQSKEIGEKKKEWAERHVHRQEFWSALLPRCKGKTKLFASISPGRQSWIGIGAGKSGVTFNFVVWRDSAAVELYIDHDHETGAGNKAIFDVLYKQRDTIEREFGGPLEWERLDDKRASRIRKSFDGVGFLDRDKWEGLQEKMIEAMVALDRSLRQRLSKIQLADESKETNAE